MDSPAKLATQGTQDEHPAPQKKPHNTSQYLLEVTIFKTTQIP